MSIVAPNYSLPPPALEPRASRAFAIFEHQIREQSRVLNLVLLAFIFIVGVLPLILTVYLNRLIPNGLLGSTSLSTFYEPIGLEIWFFLLILLVSSVGAAIIAGDVATKAMTMYLARPILPLDYLGAKSGAVAFWIFIGGVLPGWTGTVLVLALGYVSLPLALQAAAGYFVVGLFAITAYTGLAVLLSSLTSRSTLAGAGIFGALLGSDIVMNVLSGISGKVSFLYASPPSDVLAVAQGMFDVTGGALDPWSAAVALAIFAVASFSLAYLRLSRAQAIAE